MVPKSPSTVILCFSRHLERFAVEALGARQAEGAPELLLHTPRGHLGLLLVGNGAPSLAVKVEELVARGTRRFISVGNAGCVQPNFGIGATVLCTRAIRDEGTSYHYARASKYVYPSRTLSSHLRERLEEQIVRVRSGASWTADAVYRETKTEVQRYRRDGVLAVEMEASALFSVARSCSAEAAALSSVSDILDEGRWVPWLVESRAHLESLLQQTVTALGFSRRARPK